MAQWRKRALGPSRRAARRPLAGPGHHGRGRGPWGFGGPPFPGPSFAGGGRPRPRRGDVRLAVLTLLAEQPMHGYQIITELGSRSGGVWRPSPGSVYPTLQQLQDEGLVTVSEEDGRRTFSLTDAGRAEVERASAGRRAPWEDMADEADEAAGRLKSLVGQLIAATIQVATAGTHDQVAQAEKVLIDARRAMYRLLAEDEPRGQRPTSRRRLTREHRASHRGRRTRGRYFLADKPLR